MDKFVNYLQTVIDGNRLFRIIKTINEDVDFNTCHNRFDKAEAISLGIELCSDRKIKYIDEEGRDFKLIEFENLFGELKSQTTRNKSFVKKNTMFDLKLTNSNGTNKYKYLPEGYANFIFVVTKNDFYLLCKDEIKDYIVSYGDGLKAKNIPHNLCYKIFDNLNVNANKQIKMYSEQKRAYMWNYLESI